MKLYGDVRSGNCYKILLTAQLLGLTLTFEAVDVLAGATTSDAFTYLNHNQKIPVLVLDDGRVLTESNAIVNFLSAGTTLLPRDAFALAQTQQWQFFEQYSHEPYIAVARFIALYQGLPEHRRDEYHSKQVGGYKALSVMEMRLATSPFLVGASLTTADISLFAYSHVCHEGGFNLDTFPAIRAWLDKVREHPRFVPMSNFDAITGEAVAG